MFPSRPVELVPVQIAPGTKGVNVKLAQSGPPTIIGAVIMGRKWPRWWHTYYQAMTPRGQRLGQPTRDIWQPVQLLIDRFEGMSI
jgi:hypothetical protein